MADEFDEVRREPDPLARGRRATALLAVYQQRSIELARLRRSAIDEAAAKSGMTLAAVARELGLSKGRITQIRQSAPPQERALFGVGPVTVAVPQRTVPGRQLPVISTEDSIAAERVTTALEVLGFAVQQFRIPVDGEWSPSGDVIAICGPKSSRVTAEALSADPLLSFAPDDQGRFVITDRSSGQVFASGHDVAPSRSEDVAYLGRLPHPRAQLLIVAGIHAIGSVAAVEYLSDHAAEIYAMVGDQCWSAVVACSHDGETITSAEAVVPPRPHA